MLWQTKDGTKIPIEKMTDAHLRNAIAYAKRYLEVAKEEREATWMCASFCSDESVGAYYADGFSHDADMLVGYLVAKIYALEQEKNKRESTTVS